MSDSYHKSVLPQEVLEYLAPKPGGIYLDATFGGGGHTRMILRAEPTCTVIGVDWDMNALDINAPPLEEEFGERFIPLLGSFTHLDRLLKKINMSQVDGILADFGTSQYQIHELPGFSFSNPSALDMRMSPGHHKITARDIVNKASEAELVDIFFTYGEEPSARKIARLIVEERQLTPITTTTQLAALIMKIVKPFSRTIHPATKVFQALRIVVNDELQNINALLVSSLRHLKPQGRIVCISFHSLEDRLVKQFFKAHEHELTILTKKVVIPTGEEILRNASSRSSKLRAAELKANPTPVKPSR